LPLSIDASAIGACTSCLLAQGCMMNRKKTQRLYREEGLAVPKRKGRKRATGSRAPILVDGRPNTRWSVDFVRDQVSNGRRLRLLNALDDVTKECLAAIADTSISGRRVARELDVVIARRGKPGLIVSDHGTEFISNAMLAWTQITQYTSRLKSRASRQRAPLEQTFLSPSGRRRRVLTPSWRDGRW
jgi:transposase InsO family protein